MAQKSANQYKFFTPFQSEFDHKYACWASNHRGWAKMKRGNKRLAKRRLRKYENRILQKDGEGNG